MPPERIDAIDHPFGDGFILAHLKNSNICLVDATI